MLAIAACFGLALWITGLNVKYCDLRYVIPFILHFGLYVSPVGFSSAVIADEWRFWYSPNPIGGVIDGLRWCLLAGESNLDLPGYVTSLGVVVFFLWFGTRYFRRTEKTFADLS